MNLSQIDYFIEVAKRLNVTEAAKKLYISQPALSKQISLLEEELGTPLFTRNHRLTGLTEAGEILLQECNFIRKHIAETIVKVQETGCSETTGELNIGCLKGIGFDNKFMQILRKFSEKYPNCDLSICKCEFRELREQLETGKLDLIFTMSFELDFFTNVLSELVEVRSGGFLISKEHPLQPEVSGNSIILHR